MAFSSRDLRNINSNDTVKDQISWTFLQMMSFPCDKL